MNKDKNENAGGEQPVYEPAGLPDSDTNQPEEFTYPLVQSERPWLQQPIDVDAGAEFEAFKAAQTVEAKPEGEAMQRLIASNVISKDGAFREGHLEHLARVYVADKALAWRDYGDDLTVALSADGGAFAALVDKARGE
jgi:hypothetical protein